jgi:NAD(P)-dependent dehydrogenase (short-subunit alcohol dehydrogenase family)
MAENGVALIIGVGPGLGAALGRRFGATGMKVALASRDVGSLAPFLGQVAEAGGAAHAYGADGSDEDAVSRLFDSVEADLGPIDVAIYNPSGRVRASILELSADDIIDSWMVSCFGGFLFGREAAKRMVPRGQGTILFTGATASIKGYANSASFAIGKFGLRALSQSMARELGPKGIHVAHVVIDGGIGENDEDSSLRPDAIAETYYALHAQHRSAWAQEVDVRPWVESF